MDSNIMELLPLDKLGAKASQENPYVIDFGIFFPGISASDGNKVFVKIIYKNDQFVQDIQPHIFELIAIKIDTEYGNYWVGKVDIKKHEKQQPESKWGEKGRYVYRYCLYNPDYAQEHREQPEIDWIIDPFAREFGVGKLSAITVEYKDHEWSEYEKNEWKTPSLNKLVI